MSFLARRHWCCAGSGEFAPEPRAHSLKIPFARSWGAGGARAGAGGSISGTPQGFVLGFPLTSKKDACPSLTSARAATCLCRRDPSPMTLRCLEPSGNGAEGTQGQWGTSGSAEEPSPEAACLAKALRELSQTGETHAQPAMPNARDAQLRSSPGKSTLPSGPHGSVLSYFTLFLTLLAHLTAPLTILYAKESELIPFTLSLDTVKILV
ncbi:hypothetical protein CB1_002920002 [Camelus ferus]|nr:hypothetical protein CB1_002920002 [Camelus ferus]